MKYILLLLTAAALVSCAARIELSKSSSSNKMVFGNSVALIGTQDQVRERLRDISQKELYEPSCGYPKSIAMVNDRIVFVGKHGTYKGWWLAARHTRMNSWYKVEFFTHEYEFISITRPGDLDSITVHARKKGKEYVLRYEWVEASYGSEEGWKRV